MATLRAVLANVLAHPREPKYASVNLANSKIRAR